MVLTWNPNTQKVEIGRSHGLANYLVQSLSELYVQLERNPISKFKMENNRRIHPIQSIPGLSYTHVNTHTYNTYRNS